MMEILGVSIGEIAKKIAETASEVVDAAKNIETGISFPDAESILKSMLKESEPLKASETYPLTDMEKTKIKEETGWSDEIIDNIRNMDEYEKVYKNAGLHEETINGRKCLVKDIDMDYVDPKTGLTNRELMEKGRSPYDTKTGEKIELHHMGQDSDSPFAELCENSEHGDGNDATLHDKKAESWRQDSDLKNQYNRIQRPDHWKERAKEA